MLKWTDKQNGIDDVLAEDINDIAHAVIELENAEKKVVDQTYNPESQNAQSGKAVAEAVVSEQNCLMYEETLSETVSDIFIDNTKKYNVFDVLIYFEPYPDSNNKTSVRFTSSYSVPVYDNSTICGVTDIPNYGDTKYSVKVEINTILRKLICVRGSGYANSFDPIWYSRQEMFVSFWKDRRYGCNDDGSWKTLHMGGSFYKGTKIKVWGRKM